MCEKTLIKSVMPYYTWLGNQESDKDNVEFKCKICPEEKKPLNGSTRNNLLRHMKVVHKDFYKDFIGTEKNYALEQLKIILQFVEIVTVNGRPFLSLLDSGFEQFYARKLLKLKAAGYPINLNGNNFELIKTKIVDIAKRIRELIREETKGKCVSMMADIGTKNTESFLGINIQHFIDDALVCRSIGMLHLKQSHRSDDLLIVINNCLDDYGINIEQLVAVTVDNGPNVQKTARIINSIESDVTVATQQISLHDFATDDERIEAVVTHSQKSDEEVIAEMLECNDYTELMRQVLGRLYQNTGQQFLYVSGVNCCEHTTQLIMKDAFKMLPQVHSNVIDLVREVGKFLRLPSTRNDLKAHEINIKLVHLDVVTRWTSKLRMVNCIENNSKYIFDFFSYC